MYFGRNGSAGAGLYVSRAYTERLKLFRKMKRKGVDEVYGDCSPTCLSNPSRKFRRLVPFFAKFPLIFCSELLFPSSRSWLDAYSCNFTVYRFSILFFLGKDAEFVSVMDEDPNVNAPHFVERGLSAELPWTSTSMVHTDAASVETLPTSNAMEERALMPYDPTKTPFANYPSLQKFPIVVQSDLIPGLKGNCEDSKLELLTAFGLTLISVVIMWFWI